MSYGDIKTDTGIDQVDERGRRNRTLTSQEMNVFWSAGSFLSKTALPFPAADQPHRVALAELIRLDRKNRCTVTTKSPPPMSVFRVDKGDNNQSVNCATVNADASLCASAFESKTVVWSTPTHSSKHSSDDHSTSKAYQMLFHPHVMQKAELPTGRGTSCISFSPDSPMILNGSTKGDIGLWSVEASKKVVSYTGLSSRTAVWDLDWCPAGTYFSSGSSDGCARVWRSDIPFPIRVFRLPDDDGHHCQLSRWHPSCQLLAVCSEKAVQVHDISGNAVVFRFDFINATAIEFSPTGYLLAAANENYLCVWELSTGTTLFQVDLFETIVELAWTQPSASLLGDGGLKSVTQQVGVGHPLLISVDESGKLRLWDRLFVSKPPSCEFEFDQAIRPLHMHVTHRNLLVIAGVNETSDGHLADTFRSLE